VRLGAAAIVVAALAPLAGCDGVPQTELRNNSATVVTLHAVGSVRSNSPETRADLEVKPRTLARFVYRPDIALAAGNCELTFSLPEKDLSARMGAVNELEIRPDLQIYMRGRVQEATGKWVPLMVQPGGWPVAPATRTCR